MSKAYLETALVNLVQGLKDASNRLVNIGPPVAAELMNIANLADQVITAKQAYNNAQLILGTLPEMIAVNAMRQLSGQTPIDFSLPQLRAEDKDSKELEDAVINFLDPWIAPIQVRIELDQWIVSGVVSFSKYRNVRSARMVFSGEATSRYFSEYSVEIDQISPGDLIRTAAFKVWGIQKPCLPNKHELFARPTTTTERYVPLPANIYEMTEKNVREVTLESFSDQLRTIMLTTDSSSGLTYLAVLLKEIPGNRVDEIIALYVSTLAAEGVEVVKYTNGVTRIPNTFYIEHFETEYSSTPDRPSANLDVLPSGRLKFSQRGKSQIEQLVKIIRSRKELT